VAGDCAAVSRRWSAAAEVRVVDVSQPGPAEGESVREIYGVESADAVLLIRPDGYVCLAAERDASRGLDTYLRDLLVIP
jgi:hypothetical protein